MTDSMVMIKQCPSCGGQHEVELRKLSYITAGGITHWARCPKNDEPILAGANASQIEYGLYSVNDRAWLATNGLIFHTASYACAEEQRRGMSRGPLIRSWVVRAFGSPVPLIGGNGSGKDGG